MRKSKQHGKLALVFVGGTTTLVSSDILRLAQSAGASAREAATLKAIYDLEGFGGKEFNPKLTPARMVASQLDELRAMTGQARPMAA